MSKPLHAHGFSLIEIMIVIIIISILTAMAIPSYQKYTQRARFAEVITSAAFFKTAVTLALQQGALLSELSNGVFGIPEEPKKTKNLASTTVKNGIITATATDLAANATYILKPTMDGTAWAVSGSCIKLGLCSA